MEPHTTTPASALIPAVPVDFGRVLVPCALRNSLEVAKQALDGAVLVPARHNLLGHLLAHLGPHLFSLQDFVRGEEALALELGLDVVAEGHLPVHQTVGGLGVAVAGLADVELFGIGWNGVTIEVCRDEMVVVSGASMR